MTERPDECGQCKKPPVVIYKEIVGKIVTVTKMCADCPVLYKKLHGDGPEAAAETKEKLGAGLFCGHCHTSLEAVKMGNPIGCSECYNVFGDLLIQELIAENKIPAQMQNVRRNQPLHIGKTPDKAASIPPSSRLTSLNEALNDALQRENYEEAAWLRDQIKELMEKKDEQQP